MAQKAYSLSHTKWMCKYHIVFTPKYRRKVIYNQIRSGIGEILRKLCEYKGIEIIEGHLMPDHVHVLLAIPPKYSVASVMGYLKGEELADDILTGTPTSSTSSATGSSGRRATTCPPSA